MTVIRSTINGISTHLDWIQVSDSREEVQALPHLLRLSSDGEQDAVEQRFGAWRSSGDVDIHRDGGIDATPGCVIRAENAAADAAGADGHDHLGVRGGGVGLL